jgi:hypothetical protein
MKVVFVYFARISGWDLTALNELIMDSFPLCSRGLWDGICGTSNLDWFWRSRSVHAFAI